jgi:iron complex transport system substrate-binding protein
LAALFIKDAHALYLWQTPKELAGLWGGIEKAQKADLIVPEISPWNRWADSNPHYAQFDSFKNKKYIRMP